MADVSTLQSHVKRVASLGSYDGTDEEALIVAWLNDGYLWSCKEIGTPVETVTASLTSGDNEYTLSDLSLTNVVYFKHLWVTGSSPTILPLEEIDGNRIYELQMSDGGSTQDRPLYYSFDGLDQITIWPTPGAGLTLNARAVVDPPTLVVSGPSAGEETTPSKIPTAYHYQILANHAIMRAYEYRGGQPAMVNEFMQQRDRGIRELREQLQTMGGNIPPAVRIHRGRTSEQSYPDRRW